MNSPKTKVCMVVFLFFVFVTGGCFMMFITAVPKPRTSQEAQQARYLAQQARYLKNNPAMGVPLSQLQWGKQPSFEEVAARAAKRSVVISQDIQSEPRHSDAIEMNAAKSRWHIHRAESLRLKKAGLTHAASGEDRLADIAYDEYNMYYHRIQAGN